MKQTIIKRDAANKVGMTVADLTAFLADISDHNIPPAGIGGYVVKIRATWHGTIRSAQVTIEHDEN